MVGRGEGLYGRAYEEEASIDRGLLAVGEKVTGLGGQVGEEYMLCTICLLHFTCLPDWRRTTTEGSTSIPMKGFSCSMGGDGALLDLEGPDEDLARLPSTIKLRTAPCLPRSTELCRLSVGSTRDSTCNQCLTYVPNIKLFCQGLNLSV